MARCKLTSMNLRTIRKSREYQALLIDLVAMGVVGKSAAEETLGYTIPAGLLGDTTTSDDEGGESGGEQGSDTGNIVTLVYFNATANDDAGEWETAEYDLTDDPTGAGIAAFAKTEFSDDSISLLVAVKENPEYVEGESELADKYIPVDPQPETLEPGMLIVAAYPDNNDSGGITQETLPGDK